MRKSRGSLGAGKQTRIEIYIYVCIGWLVTGQYWQAGNWLVLASIG